MALTRPGPLEDRQTPVPAPGTSAVGAQASPPRQRARAAAPARSYAALPPTVDLALRAVRLEALLGDPLDEANPYGFRALAQGAPVPDRAAALLADLVRAEFLPAGGSGERGEGGATDGSGGGGEYVDAEQLVRVLRPLLRRDLALGHAQGVQGLRGARAAGVPAGAPEAGSEAGPQAGLEALLAPAALIASAGTALRAAVRVVADRGPHDAAVRQWRGPLAAAFAELLACESLLGVALRALALPQGCGPAVRAAAGYVVPVVVRDVLDEVGLVLRESGQGAEAPARRTVARLLAGLPEAGAGDAQVAARQAELVRELPALAAAFARRGDAAGSGPLLRLGEELPLRSFPPSPGSDDTLVAVPAAAHARLSAAAGAGPDGDGGDPSTAALARVAGRLLSEQRALLRPSRAAEEADPRDPAVRAVADRQAMLLLAAAVLGVQGAADDGRGLFLGRRPWALLATLRITERLGIAPEGPGGPAATAAQQQVWAELDARDRRGVDCDVYATRVLW
ncbi:hypothetical protein ABZ128_32095 [Streptomyces sp. NPDC006326]|uniref:hypothetical protein n=1 Tax=Streptomyces sp. NPDC006326 TaxID=3156752 RepID=UPI0033ADC672